MFNNADLLCSDQDGTGEYGHVIPEAISPFPNEVCLGLNLSFILSKMC